MSLNALIRHILHFYFFSFLIIKISSLNYIVIIRKQVLKDIGSDRFTYIDILIYTCLDWIAISQIIYTILNLTFWSNMFIK